VIRPPESCVSLIGSSLFSKDATMSAPAIRAAEVRVFYGLREILKEVSLEIAAGERVAIIGPNGVGKTTLLNVLGGLLTPQFGDVELHGLQRRGSIDEEREIRRKTVFLPMECWFPEDRTAREYLHGVGEIYDVPLLRLADHVPRLLQLFQMEAVADRTIRTYSAGQKKKTALCAALVAETSLLLLDKPFSGGLDPAGILALSMVLQSLSKSRSRTVVFTTPVPELVTETADRILVIKEGRIAGDYRLEDLRRGLTSGQSLADAMQQLIFPEAVEQIRDYLKAGA
jgi:ABC-2 type transport system ATP-binding protein